MTNLIRPISEFAFFFFNLLSTMLCDQYSYPVLQFHLHFSYLYPIFQTACELNIDLRNPIAGSLKTVPNIWIPILLSFPNAVTENTVYYIVNATSLLKKKKLSISKL